MGLMLVADSAFEGRPNFIMDMAMKQDHVIILLPDPLEEEAAEGRKSYAALIDEIIKEREER